MNPKSANIPIRDAITLQVEIDRLKLQIQEEEAQIADATRKIPLQGLKIAGLGLAEIIAGKQGLSGITQLVQAGYYWIKGRKKQAGEQEIAKDKLTQGAGKLGLAGIIHLLGTVLKR
jgi:hypothetical protein